MLAPSRSAARVNPDCDLLKDGSKPMGSIPNETPERGVTDY